MCSRLEAPEVDGVVYLKGRGIDKHPPGTILSAKVVAALDYDIVANA